MMRRRRRIWASPDREKDNRLADGQAAWGEAVESAQKSVEVGDVIRRPGGKGGTCSPNMAAMGSAGTASSREMQNLR
jgi:hypothetical protein